MRNKLLFVSISMLFVFISNIYALDKVYFLPKDSKMAKEDILKSIKNTKEKIEIAMYNIKYEKFTDALEKKAKDGVDITIFYDKKDVNFSSKIKLRKTKTKLHTKIMIVDEKMVFFGSPNWSKKSFNENYEVLYASDKKKIVKKFNVFFKELKEKN